MSSPRIRFLYIMLQLGKIQLEDIPEKYQADIATLMVADNIKEAKS